jgi:hypothetical protein
LDDFDKPWDADWKWDTDEHRRTLIRATIKLLRPPRKKNPGTQIKFDERRFLTNPVLFLICVYPENLRPKLFSFVL